MALTVANNTSAAMALGELNKNSNRLSKDLKKISSGTKITGAGDGASEYAISEGMRSMIRALEQDIQNSKTGRDLIKVAEGGIQCIIEELRTLKELAINSANDHNSAVDRATLQKEFDQRMANIDDIAEETNYNGKLLLNGTYQYMLEGSKEMGLGTALSSDTVTTVNTTPPVVTTTTSTSVRTSSPVSNTTRNTSVTTSATMPTTGTTEGMPVTTTNTVRTTSTTGPIASSNSNAVTSRNIEEDENTVTEVRRDLTTTNTTNTTVETVTDTTTVTTTKVSTIVSAEAVTGTSSASYRMITNGMNSLTEGGVWKFADDYTGTLNISVDNVTILGADTTLSDVYIKDSSSNLYLKNVSISNTQDKSAVAFTGTEGILHIIGDNSITSMCTPILNPRNLEKAIINSTGNLSILGNGSLDILRTNTQSNVEGGLNALHYGAVIGGNYAETCGDISIGDGVSLNISVVYKYLGGFGFGAAIGSGSDGQCGNISIGSNTNINITRPFETGDRPDLAISHQGAGIGAGIYGSCGNIYVYSDANLYIHTSSNLSPAPGIGTGGAASSCGDIELFSGVTYDILTECPILGVDSVFIGAGRNNCTCGNIDICKNITQIPSYTNDSASTAGIGKNTDTSTCGMVRYKEIERYEYSNDADTTDPSVYETTVYNVTTETITTTTVSTTVNETKTTTYETYTEIREDITTSVYEKKELEVTRINVPLIIHTGPKANEELRVYIEDMGPEALGILDVKIDPREAAIKALGKIDHAIDYALDQATQMGAYISRLEQTEENLVIASENAQSSESTIRDADMAKEMMAYTKDNILTQSAQAMLAQANQSAGGVLSLLQ
ncbi:flagellin [Selenomonas sp. KH1T6]|uniref:flagellin N-terminal helical domain-containing protein n=1 Tax=Selenomonas sp. KH1T6 TaxID=3158784 RepID=UPI0008A78F6D|nr:Flagellin FlgL [Selenomonas ruminantium]